MICSFCHEDCETKYKPLIMDILREEGGWTVNLCNPGGRYFETVSGKHFQISDECSKDDLSTMIRQSREQCKPKP